LTFEGELQMNRFLYGVALLGIMLGCAGQAKAGTLLAIDWDTGTLYNLSTTNAALTPIGSTGLSLPADIQFAPNGTLYAFTAGGSSTLYTINPVTAKATAVGPLGISSIFEGGLAFSPGGIAYGTNGDNSGNPQLFSINLNTGQATVIGTISGGDHDINGLAYRSDGKLIGLDRVTNSLLVIDPTTAASSVLAAIGPTVGALGGMTVSGGTGYFDTAGPAATNPGSNSLYSFDLFTGSSSLIGSFSPTISDEGISGIAAAPAQTGSVPEPASLFLVTISVVGMAGYASRRRRLRVA
jgi:PEP-CTERM motif